MKIELLEEDGCLLHLAEPILAICEKYGKNYCASCFREGIAKCLSPDATCAYEKYCLVKQYQEWLTQAREKRISQTK